MQWFRKCQAQRAADLTVVRQNTEMREQLTIALQELTRALEAATARLEAE